MHLNFFRDDSMIETNSKANVGCPSSKWCRLFKYYDAKEGTMDAKEGNLLDSK